MSLSPKTNSPKTGSPKTTSFWRSSLVVGALTLVSRVLGLARDIVIAQGFGAGASADAFFVAFKIPNFLRRLFAEGAFAQAFVPVLSAYRTAGDPRAVRELIDSVAGTLGASLILITSLGVLGAPVLATVFAPGFYLDNDPRFALTVEMLRITFPYLLLISLTALAGSLLNAYDRFAVPALTPVLLNLSLIGSVFWLQPHLDTPVMALAWGVLLAGVLQLLWPLPFLGHMGLLPRPRLGWRHPGVQRILKLMLPALFGVSVSQLNLLLDTLLASFLITGSVSWLYFSDRLVELPLGVLGIAIGTVILPGLSRDHAGKDPAAFAATLDWALRMVLLLGLPAALGLWLLAEPLIVTLFQYGALEVSDVPRTAASLRAYSLGLLAFMLIKVLAPGYFARQDTRTPVRIGIQAMAANMLMNLALIVPLKHVGLALATALSACLNAGLLARGLKHAGVLRWQPGWPLFLARLLLAALLMSLLLLWLQQPLEHWVALDLWGRVAALTLRVLAGAGCFLAALWILGLRPAQLRH